MVKRKAQLNVRRMYGLGASAAVLLEGSGLWGEWEGELLGEMGIRGLVEGSREWEREVCVVARELWERYRGRCVQGGAVGGGVGGGGHLNLRGADPGRFKVMTLRGADGRREEIEWVSAHVGDEMVLVGEVRRPDQVRPEDAPSRAAWNELEWVRRGEENEREWRKSYLVKLDSRKGAEGDDGDGAGLGDESILEACERVLVLGRGYQEKGGE